MSAAVVRMTMVFGKKAYQLTSLVRAGFDFE